MFQQTLLDVFTLDSSKWCTHMTLESIITWQLCIKNVMWWATFVFRWTVSQKQQVPRLDNIKPVGVCIGFILWSANPSFFLAYLLCWLCLFNNSMFVSSVCQTTSCLSQVSVTQQGHICLISMPYSIAISEPRINNIHHERNSYHLFMNHITCVTWWTKHPAEMLHKHLKTYFECLWWCLFAWVFFVITKLNWRCHP